MSLLLFVVLSVLLRGDYLPGNVLFSNDGPLGELMSQCHRLPDRFTGCWEDLNLLGFRAWGASPSISFGLQFLLGPVAFSKLYVPFALLILGCGAWCFFRQSGLTPAACFLSGLAATLNWAFSRPPAGAWPGTRLPSAWFSLPSPRWRTPRLPGAGCVWCWQGWQWA